MTLWHAEWIRIYPDVFILSRDKLLFDMIVMLRKMSNDFTQIYFLLRKTVKRSFVQYYDSIVTIIHSGAFRTLKTSRKSYSVNYSVHFAVLRVYIYELCYHWLCSADRAGQLALSDSLLHCCLIGFYTPDPTRN